jgi:hypothetical protein
MGRNGGMMFDPDQEYCVAVENRGFANGGLYIDAIIEDARKTLPVGAEFTFISWTEDGKRKTGWAYNLKTERTQQKLFNPLASDRAGVLRT